MKKIFSALLLALVLSPPDLLAASKADHLTLTLTGGGYSFDSSQDLDSGAVAGVKVGYDIEGAGVASSLGLEAVAHALVAGDADGYLLRLDAIYPILKKKKLIPFLAVGAGYISVDANGDSAGEALVSYGGGLKYPLRHDLLLRADVRHNLWFQADRVDNFEYTAGLSYLFGQEPEKKPPPPADADRDGVPDRQDKCPETPVGMKVDKSGCPVNPPDADQDGVPDYLDRCPDTPKGSRPGKDGCLPDSDQDGVPDPLDECPGTVGLSVDERGCVKIEKKPKTTPPGEPPVPAPPALPAPLSVPAPGGEGQADSAPFVEAKGHYETQPPSPPAAVEKAGQEGLPATGAPSKLPPARHTVRQAATAVRGTSATVEADTARNILPPAPVPGTTAPPPAGAELSSRRVQTLVRPVAEKSVTILFAYDDFRIRPEERRKVSAIGELMKENPTASATIEGHSDSRGSEEYNLQLSLKRAEAVRKFLVGFGIEPARLQVRALGESQPAADNATAKGRSLNRRAVTIVIQETKPQEEGR